MADIGVLNGLLPPGQDVLDEVDVDGLVRGQVETDIDGEEADNERI